MIGLISTLGIFVLFMGTSIASADAKGHLRLIRTPIILRRNCLVMRQKANMKLLLKITSLRILLANQIKIRKLISHLVRKHLTILLSQKQWIHQSKKQDENQVVEGATQSSDSNLLDEILAQTSEVGEYKIYVKNDDELLISGPVPSRTVNDDVNYPTLESSLDSASIYLGQKNRSKEANEEDAQSGLGLVED